MYCTEMKNEIVWVFWFVLALIIAEEHSKHKHPHLSNRCTAQGFKELVDIYSDPVCFIDGNVVQTDMDRVEVLSQQIPDKSVNISKSETVENESLEGSEKTLINSIQDDETTQEEDKVSVDPGVLKGVVSGNVGEETTEPKAPDVKSRSAHSTVKRPNIEQNLEPPTGSDVPEEKGKDKEKDKDKPPDEPEAPKADDMPSFDEWKRLRLAEEEEERKHLKQQGSPSASPTNGQNGHTKAKPNANRVNYASASCGAKVVGVNSEAQNVGSILSENKDKYVIQPCKAKKWISIELCEPIQVSTIELGNLEFFSSQPESFLIYISDRLSAKDWVSLGTFHARDVRQIQSFPVTDETYAKYIKIEMVSHYGQEHYCPLTVVRVFGTTVHEEDVDEVHEVVENFPVDEETVDTKDSEGSLLKLAIDTAQSMLQDVIGKKEEPAESGEQTEEVKLKNDTNDTKPCPPDVQVASTNNSTKGEPSIFPETPTSTSKPVETPGTIIPPIVRLVEAPHTSLQKHLKSCSFCEDRPPNTCHMDRRTTCGYYVWMVYQYPMCCLEYFLHPGPQNALDLHDTPIIQSPSIIEEKSKTTMAVDLKPSSVVVESTQIESKVKETETGERTDRKTEELKRAPTKAKDASPTQTKHTITPHNGKVEIPKKKLPATEIKPTKTQEPQQATQQVKLESSQKQVPVTQKKQTEKLKVPVTSQSEKEVKTTELPKETKTEEKVEPEPTEIVCDSETENANGQACHMGPNVVEIRPSTTEESTITEPTAIPKEPVKPVKKDPVQKDPVITDAEPQYAPESDSAEPWKETHTYATEGIPDLEDVDLPEQDIDEEVQIMKKPQVKETTLMKLRNRMKELELNLNLSSRYLEELSQRYKRQMEEMYTSLNHTIEKLSDTSKSAEDRDKRQQQEIKELKTTVEVLNGSLMNLTGQMEGLSQQVRDISVDLLM